MPIKEGDTYLQVRVSKETAEKVREIAKRERTSLNIVLARGIAHLLDDMPARGSTAHREALQVAITHLQEEVARIGD